MVEPALYLVIVLALVAFAAGFIDAIAGGGGMLTVPALLALGLPPHLALGTNKGASTFGTLAATLSFLRAGKLSLRGAAQGFLLGGLGAVIGASLQLVLDRSFLKPIVLILLLLVAAFLAFVRPKAAPQPPTPRAPHLEWGIAFVLGIYDGFFGPGTGTFLIVLHVAFLGVSLSTATASAKAVNLGSNVASLLTFAIRGTVIYRLAVPMAIANIAGGLLGAQIALRKGDKLIRAIVLLVSVALVLRMLWELLSAR